MLASERLSVLEGVGGVECILLLTAAYFHDIGFGEQFEGHEEILEDADLDVLDRDDFLDRNMEPRTERATLGMPSTHVDWYTSQLHF